MGSRTPFIGIYIPAAGETNYDQSFASGMNNIDNHDHSGATNKGVPINSSGLSDGSVTYKKLNTDVADTNSGIGFNPLLPNQLQMQGILNNLYVMGLGAALGFVTRNGNAVATRNFINGKGMNISPLDGSADTTFAIADIQVNPTQPAFSANMTGGPYTITAGGVDTQLVFPTEFFDQGSNYSTGVSRFTAPVTGIYLISVRVLLRNIIADNDTEIKIYVNGVSSVTLGTLNTFRIQSVNDYMFSASQLMGLTAGDEVKIFASVDMGVPAGTADGGRFTGVLLC